MHKALKYQAHGKSAENTAANFLIREGFTIAQRNLRCGRAEIDIIAHKERALIFVEVKMRRNTHFGHAETFVSERQQDLYHEAASRYMEAVQWPFAIRFDIISIEKQQQRMVLNHFEDAF